MPPTARKKKHDIRATLASYKADPDHSTPQRLAQLLNHCAVTAPMLPVPWQWAAKICFTLNKLPPEDGRRVESVKTAATGAKRILQQRFGRSLEAVPGYGVRGTVDATHQAETTHRAAARRVAAAVRGLEREDAILDIHSILDAELRSRVRSTRKVTKVLGSPEVMKPLLLPKDTGKK